MSLYRHGLSCFKSDTQKPEADPRNSPWTCRCVLHNKKNTHSFDASSTAAIGLAEPTPGTISQGATVSSRPLLKGQKSTFEDLNDTNMPLTITLLQPHNKRSYWPCKKPASSSKAAAYSRLSPFLHEVTICIQTDLVRVCRHDIQDRRVSFQTQTYLKLAKYLLRHTEQFLFSHLHLMYYFI